MRRLALLALVVPLVAGCGWANLLLAPSYSYSQASGAAVHRGCVMYTPRHKVRPCASPYRSGPAGPPPMQSHCMVVTPDGMQHRCGPAGPAFRSCGMVGVGIGWHLSVTSMSCHEGTKLAHHYFNGSNNDTVRTVLGYTCVANPLRVVCQRHASIAEIVANH